MWNEEYEKLSSYEKGEFRRLSNYLLSHTYLVRYEYQSIQQMMMPSSDYTMISRLFPVMREYFSVSGWKLEKEDNYGVMSLINISMRSIERNLANFIRCERIRKPSWKRCEC